MFEVKNPYQDTGNVIAQLHKDNRCLANEFRAWEECHKATLNAVVKWLDELCTEHGYFTNGKRFYCPICQEELRKTAEVHTR